jgi:hypothetical protein
MSYDTSLQSLIETCFVAPVKMALFRGGVIRTVTLLLHPFIRFIKVEGSGAVF